MARVTVHRHGDRWAVAEQGAESPAKEFRSLQEAEVAARELAGPDEIETIEDDPTSLDAVQDPAAGEPAPEGPDEGAVDAGKHSRSIQPGL